MIRVEILDGLLFARHDGDVFSIETREGRVLRIELNRVQAAHLSAQIKATWVAECDNCHGSGKVHFSEMGGDGPGQSATCSRCKGSGNVDV